MTDIGRSRRQWRQAFFILLAAATVVVVVLTIAMAGRKPSYASEAGEVSSTAESIALAHLLAAQQPPATRAFVLRELRRDNPKARILATDTTIVFGALTFRFTAAGRLSGVEQR